MLNKRIVITVLIVLVALGSAYAYYQASRTVMRIYDYETKKIYVEFPAKSGDRLFFGWVHSLEHISWHEYYHITKDNTLMLDTISFPAFGAGIPENKGKRTRIEKGRIYMEEIGQEFKQFDWINSHYATKEIRLNDELITSGRLLPEHRRMILCIEKVGVKSWLMK